MGTKQSRKEMKASLINEISKQYKQKYEGTIKVLQDRLNQVNKLNQTLQDNCHQLNNENQELKNNLHICEDWIQRLQKWLELPEDERIKAMQEFNQKYDEFEFSKEFDTKLRKMFGPYYKIIGGLV